MATKNIVFSDRLAGISVQGNTARLDFAVVAGTAKNKEGKPAVKLEVTHQLVIPLDAFVQAVGMQDKVVKELVTRAKKRRDAKTAGADKAESQS